jgi:hypothetical protein
VVLVLVVNDVVELVKAVVLPFELEEVVDPLVVVEMPVVVLVCDPDIVPVIWKNDWELCSKVNPNVVWVAVRLRLNGMEDPFWVAEIVPLRSSVGKVTTACPWKPMGPIRPNEIENVF